MHHCSFFILDEPLSSSDQYSVKSKDFIHWKVDEFKNPISAPDAFEEGNMANISPTLKVNISTKPEVIEHITLRASFSLEEVASYKTLFQEFCDIFAWSYTEMYGLDPSIVEHHIDTWLDVAPVFQKQRPIHSSKLRSKNCVKQVSYTPLHLPLGFLILFPSTKRKVPFT